MKRLRRLYDEIYARYQLYVARWTAFSVKWQLQLIFLPLFILMFALSKQGDLLFAMIKMASLFLRRGAQALMLRAFGGTHVPLMVFPLGVILHTPAKREVSMHSTSFAYQTGPLVEIGLALIGLMLRSSTHQLLSTIGTYLFLVNGVSALWSLVPIGGRDGGLVIRNIYLSSGRIADILISILLTVIGGSFFLMMLATPLGRNAWIITAEFIQQLGPMPLIVILIIGGAWYNQRSDDDTLATQPGNLTVAQKSLHLLIYVGLVSVSLWVASAPST